jgi:hypothetical protein
MFTVNALIEGHVLLFFNPKISKFFTLVPPDIHCEKGCPSIRAFTVYATVFVKNFVIFYDTQICEFCVKNDFKEIIVSFR